MTAGLVVAGGYSTRFGLAEKPLVPIDGERMLVRVVRALDRVADDVVIDCRADQVEPFRNALETVAVEPSFAVDEQPDGGPIAGLANGLAAIDDDEIAVLSCDRPGVTPGVLDRLRSRRRREDLDVAVPTIDGHVQPLCGVYRTEGIREAVDEALATGERRLCAIPRDLASCAVTERALADVVDPAAIASVDTPLEARLWPPSGEQVSAWEETPEEAASPRSLAGD